MTRADADNIERVGMQTLISLARKYTHNHTQLCLQVKRVNGPAIFES